MRRSIPMGMMEDRGDPNGSSLFEDVEGEEEEVTQKIVTKNENQAVWASRIGVISFLLIAAAVSGGLTYRYIRGEEQEDFEQTTQSLANTIIQASQENLQDVFGTLHSLSVTITSLALVDQEKSSTTWPFITVPDFEVHASNARNKSQSLLISFLPLISEAQRSDWEAYSVEHQEWIRESYREAEEELNNLVLQDIPTHIWTYPPKNRRQLGQGGCENDQARRMEEREPIPEPQGNDPYSPVWHLSPPPPPDDTSIINYNLFDRPVFRKAVDFISYTKKPSFLDVCKQTAWFGAAAPPPGLETQTVLVEPVFANFSNEDVEIVGHLVAVVPWAVFFENTLNEGSPRVSVVLENTCDEAFTYEVESTDAHFMGNEDHHNAEYNNHRITAPFADFANPAEDILDAGLGEVCVYTISVYPTKSMEESFFTNDPALFAFIVSSIFVMSAIVFVIYDWLVRRLKAKIVHTAENTHKIVSSLFPANVRDQLLSDAAAANNGKSNFTRLTDKAAQVNKELDVTTSKPMADLFPSATILFGDICGFTAWSSTRDPTQVFTLLESLYGAFDAIAKRQKIFKVETIGDCYVAVSGLPDPRDDHAVAMARFATSCMEAMGQVTKSLQSSLGPDTNDLSIRIGLHSGAVTAGVLRGERCRFQLFGDTVNVAARMESTGVSGRIQVSSATALELKAYGKSHWLVERPGGVECKGKGLVSSFFLSCEKDDQPPHPLVACASTTTEPDKVKEKRVPSYEDKRMKLVEWNCELLAETLRKIIARRQEICTTAEPSSVMRVAEMELMSSVGLPLEELVEVIRLPHYSTAKHTSEPTKIELSENVHSQLRDYVRTLSALYTQSNAFHNFEHASHVTLSVNKLLGRIIAPNDMEHDSAYDPTFGITSDPLTHFSMHLAALVHDVDHAGVPNQQLPKEKPSLARAYMDKSVAEQNSIDVSFRLLMKDDYEDLRRAIYATKEELYRFRQIVVNAVLATDIMDKELGHERKERWSKVFSESTPVGVPAETRHRKATIVLEHLIQASDVAHTMQHWHVYRKWNARFFQECYEAYQQGKSDINPAENWYHGELGFFDFYIIPLAKKLKECGAFGVCSDEFMSYALSNRQEWEVRGREIVEQLVESVQQQKPDKK